MNVGKRKTGTPKKEERNDRTRRAMAERRSWTGQIVGEKWSQERRRWRLVQTEAVREEARGVRKQPGGTYINRIYGIRNGVSVCKIKKKKKRKEGRFVEARS